ncbi:hypothetical protein [Candidatus Liberibacter sp.]|uniref:hypothetical protein n=1 Tax=Candidatus Liberibacter sp. TaxID=34022 RepID=UPI0015F3BB15|nr:hypothetical protein [Candidatus Liberibacter sp.]MBA5724351.1 hypothetical protein [Candidatus Liberibacter sp.]
MNKSQENDNLFSSSMMIISLSLLKKIPIGKVIFFINRGNHSINTRQLSVWFRKKAKQAGITNQHTASGNYRPFFPLKQEPTTHDLMVSHGWKSIIQAESIYQRSGSYNARKAIV